MRILLNLINNNRGATAIEYALLASLIAIAAIAGFQNLGTSVQSKFEAIDSAI